MLPEPPFGCGVGDIEVKPDERHPGDGPLDRKEMRGLGRVEKAARLSGIEQVAIDQTGLVRSVDRFRDVQENIRLPRAGSGSALQGCKFRSPDPDLLARRIVPSEGPTPQSEVKWGSPASACSRRMRAKRTKSRL